MKNLQQIRNAAAIVALFALPFLSQAQEIKVQGGNVKIKTAETEIETKNGNASIKTNPTKKSSYGTTKAKLKTITGNNLNKTITCNGEDVNITGNENNITIIGYAKNVKVMGSDNEVHLDKVVAIRTLGNDNDIAYKTSPNKNGKALISSTGSDNSIYKK